MMPNNFKAIPSLCKFEASYKEKKRFRQLSSLWNQLHNKIQRQNIFYPPNIQQISDQNISSQRRIVQTNFDPKEQNQILKQMSQENQKNLAQQDILLIKNTIIDQQDKQKKAKRYKYMYLQFSIAKHPLVPFFIMFIPLFIISIINLFIYFAPNDYNVKIATIATLLISYISYISIFRQQIPQCKQILLVQLVVYSQIICSFFTLLSCAIEDGQPNVRKNFLTVQGFFWASLILTVASYLPIIIVSLVYIFCFKPNLDPIEKIKRKTLRHVVWNNYSADILFFHNQNIKQLKDFQQFDHFLNQKGDCIQFNQCCKQKQD